MNETINSDKNELITKQEHETLFNAIMDGLVQVNLLGEIVYANHSAQRILNTKKSEITGKFFFSTHWKQMDEKGNVIPPENLPLAIALRNQSEVGPIEHKLQDEKGNWKWVSVYATPLFNCEKKIYGAVATFREITKQKQVELDLKKTHHELKQKQFAIDQHAIVAVTDFNGKITFVNEKFCKISEYSQTELLGQDHRIINSGHHSKFFFQNLYSKIQSGEIWHSEMKNISKYGNIFWVETTIIPLFNETDGAIDHFISFGTDITRQKKEQEELDKSQIFANAVIDSVSAHICVLNKKGEILTVNKAWRDFYSQNSKQDSIQWTGINYLNICDRATGPEADDALITSEGIRSVMEGKKDEFIFEYPCHSLTEKRWFSIRATRFHDDSGNIVIAHELITKRKLAEEEIKRYTKELENINQTKDKFFKIIAHDLRNPFAGIIGVTELLDTEISGEKKEIFLPLKRYVDLILSSSRSAFTLLENLMQWAKTQTGDISFNPQTIFINDMINSVVQLLSGNAFKKNIVIEVDVKKEDSIYADTTLLSTILRNLLTNAIKFSYSNSKIIVSAMRKENFQIISITDFGTGIDSVNLEKIFRIDSKFSKPGTNNEKGSGLGLILCKEFVELQGGCIWVESELKKGSTFSFTLPIEKIYPQT